MRSLFILLTSLIYLNSSAQKIHSTAPIDHSKSLLIKVNFLSLLDLQLPTIQAGVEKGISKNSAIEFSYGIPTGPYQGINGTYFKYYKLKSGYKLYIESTRYIEAEIFNSHVKYDNFSYTYYHGSSNQLYRADYAQGEKKVTGFDIKFGQMYKLGRKMFIEYVGGLGIRNVYIHLPVATNIQPVNQRPHGFGNYDKEGNKITPYFSISLALGYRIR